MHDRLVGIGRGSVEWGAKERRKEGRRKGKGLRAYPREDDASDYEHLSQGCDLSVPPLLSLVAEAETDAGVTMVLHTLSHRDDTIPGPLNGARFGARDT